MNGSLEVCVFVLISIDITCLHNPPYFLSSELCYRALLPQTITTYHFSQSRLSRGSNLFNNYSSMGTLCPLDSPLCTHTLLISTMPALFPLCGFPHPYFSCILYCVYSPCPFTTGFVVSVHSPLGRLTTLC